jgi:hypothetical protein
LAQNQKQIERSTALQAASRLGEAWKLEDCLHPDFLVTTPVAIFGLELTECHIGPVRKGGSRMRKAERANHEWLAEIREKVEAATGLSLHVRYYGAATVEARQEVINAILAETQKGDAFDTLDYRFADGRIWAFETPASSWNVSSDWNGDFETDGRDLQRAVDAKVPKLRRYREQCSDVRLLVYAQRMYNSGKLELPEGFEPELHGFDAVYFFSYPSSVHAFYRRG